MSSWLWSTFYFTETEISSKNAEEGTISRQSPSSSVKFLPGLFKILNFLHPKAFKIKTHRGESGFSRVIPTRAVTTRLWPGIINNNNNTLFVPNSIQKYGRGVQAAPNNHRSKRKVAAILRWFIYNHLGQISHTHKHKTHTRACALNTKTNKIKKVKDVNVKKKTTKSQMNYGVKILHNFK